MSQFCVYTDATYRCKGKGKFMEKGNQFPVYSVEPKDVLRFQVERNMKAVFWAYLAILEDLGVEHDVAMKKLHDALPEEYKTYVNLADYLTEDKGAQIRKRILDIGNNHLREINTIIESFEITLKQIKK